MPFHHSSNRSALTWKCWWTAFMYGNAAHIVFVVQPPGSPINLNNISVKPLEEDKQKHGSFHPSFCPSCNCQLSHSCIWSLCSKYVEVCTVNKELWCVAGMFMLLVSTKIKEAVIPGGFQFSLRVWLFLCYLLQTQIYCTMLGRLHMMSKQFVICLIEKAVTSITNTNY